MKNAQPNQIIRLHTLLNKLGIMDEKRTLVASYTEGRESSSKEMYTHEIGQLIEYLFEMTRGDQNAADKMRKKLLYYGYQMGYEQPRSKSELGLSPADINFIHVDTWCKSERSAIKKSMDDMTLKELTRAVSQFELVYKSTIKSIHANGN